MCGFVFSISWGIRRKSLGGLPQTLLEPVFTRNICGFSSTILLQTRQKYAGGLSPGKYFSRRMQQNLPKRHVYTLVKTGSYSAEITAWGIRPYDKYQTSSTLQRMRSDPVLWSEHIPREMPLPHRQSAPAPRSHGH